MSPLIPEVRILSIAPRGPGRAEISVMSMSGQHDATAGADEIARHANAVPGVTARRRVERWDGKVRTLTFCTVEVAGDIQAAWTAIRRERGESDTLPPTFNAPVPAEGSASRAEVRPIVPRAAFKRDVEEQMNRSAGRRMYRGHR